MRYGDLYRVIELSPAALDIVRKAISNKDLKWKDSAIDGKGSKSTIRKSEVAWINDTNLFKMLMSVVGEINKLTEWNLNIQGCEPVQFGIYTEDNFYDWHVDQHNRSHDPRMHGCIRKVSMSLLMNSEDEFEGGELDIEIYKPGTNPRYDTVKLPKGSAVFFQSDMWHRVRPVTKGIRKSLVAWFYGPPYT